MFCVSKICVCFRVSKIYIFEYSMQWSDIFLPHFDSSNSSIIANHISKSWAVATVWRKKSHIHLFAKDILFFLAFQDESLESVLTS